MPWILLKHQWLGHRFPVVSAIEKPICSWRPLADSGKLGSMDLVEINPILDVGNKIAELAVD